MPPERLCAACQQAFSDRSPMVAFWVTDPITGKQVHRECLTGGAIIRHPVAPPRDAKHSREAVPGMPEGLPEP